MVGPLRRPGWVKPLTDQVAALLASEMSFQVFAFNLNRVVKILGAGPLVKAMRAVGARPQLHMHRATRTRRLPLAATRVRLDAFLHSLGRLRILALNGIWR